MVTLFEELAPFFTDNYREYGVREYARESGISAPTASKRLKRYASEGLLLFREERGVHLYRASRTPLFIDLQRAYYRHLLEPLARKLKERCVASRVVLFGSATTGSLSSESDLDIYVDAEQCDTSAPSVTGHEIELHFRGVSASVQRAIREGLEL